MRTAIILGACIIAVTINDFKGFPNDASAAIIFLLIMMFVWDMVEYFK